MDKAPEWIWGWNPLTEPIEDTDTPVSPTACSGLPASASEAHPGTSRVAGSSKGASKASMMFFSSTALGLTKVDISNVAGLKYQK